MKFEIELFEHCGAYLLLMKVLHIHSLLTSKVKGIMATTVQQPNEIFPGMRVRSLCNMSTKEGICHKNPKLGRAKWPSRRKEQQQHYRILGWPAGVEVSPSSHNVVNCLQIVFH